MKDQEGERLEAIERLKRELWVAKAKLKECIYHVPGGAFYDKTKLELCFATEQEAREAGCQRSKR